MKINSTIKAITLITIAILPIVVGLLAFDFTPIYNWRGFTEFPNQKFILILAICLIIVVILAMIRFFIISVLRLANVGFSNLSFDDLTYKQLIRVTLIDITAFIVIPTIVTKLCGGNFIQYLIVTASSAVLLFIIGIIYI